MDYDERYMSDERYKYTDDYFDTNFYYDNGVIRRKSSIAEYENACNVSSRERRIELYRVIHHFVDKNHIKNNELYGFNKTSYEYDEDTYCICGQRSQLFECVHKKTGIRFYMGSSCIKLFQADFEPENDNGVCLECCVNLRKKGNKKKEKVKNYDGSSVKICFECLKNRWVNRYKKDYTGRIFETLKKVCRNLKEIKLREEEEKRRMEEEKRRMEEEKRKKEEEQHHIKILRMLRNQTNEMLRKYNNNYS